jgi:hypothetical protein
LNEGPYRERVRLLESTWLMDWAIDELRSVVALDASATWAGSEMARLERERGRYHIALRYAKRYVPSYFAQDIPDLSREVWELLFPRPYWDQLKKQAAAAKVDPYLVAGLIRQESNLVGLMQLLPSTARDGSPRSRSQAPLTPCSTCSINLVSFYLKRSLTSLMAPPNMRSQVIMQAKTESWNGSRTGHSEPAEFVEHPVYETAYVQQCCATRRCTATLPRRPVASHPGLQYKRQPTERNDSTLQYPHRARTLPPRAAASVTENTNVYKPLGSAGASIAFLFWRGIPAEASVYNDGH